METCNSKLELCRCPIARCVLLAALGIPLVAAMHKSDPPGIGTYTGKRCLRGTDDTEGAVPCTNWDPSWCTFSGQECSGCFPDAANSFHETCKPTVNVLDTCRDFGKGPFCGQRELRRCTSDGQGGYACVWHADVDGSFCARWKCENVPAPKP